MQVLLLNASYEPLHICTWQRAMILMIKGKAVAVESNPRKKLGSGYCLPLVIRLLHYVKIPHKDIPLTRRNIMHRDQHTCQYCGLKSNHLTIDHVFPRSRGGGDRWDNVVAACVQCNVKKGNKTPEEAHMPLAQKPTRPYHFIHFELSKQQTQARTHYQRWRKYLFFGD
ncbi:MAG: HNH endonuclease [Candidatus Melainabacteria bacterium]|nr:HNH endonuclease [Candidatus Melainabacteria bacterium]